jgi:hypothetical protein
MPRGDGMGPPRDSAQRGQRMSGSRPGAGPGGNCVCPECGEKVTHNRGVPCFNMTCPKCGAKMTRE